MYKFLISHPQLLENIQKDIEHCNPDTIPAKINGCESLVFDEGYGPGNRCVHYDCTLEGNLVSSFGSTLDCSDQDYEDGLAAGLVWEQPS